MTHDADIDTTAGTLDRLSTLLGFNRRDFKFIHIPTYRSQLGSIINGVNLAEVP
jgi:hypothetical protein